MEPLDPTNIDASGHTCKRSERVVRQRDYVAVAVQENSPRVVLIWVQNGQQQGRVHVDRTMQAEDLHHTIVYNAVEGRVFGNFVLVVEEAMRGFCGLTKERRQDGLTVGRIMFDCRTTVGIGRQNDGPLTYLLT